MGDRNEPRLVDQVAAVFESLGTNGRDAVERLRGLYAADVHFEDPMQTVDGLDGFLEANRRLLRRLRRLEVTVTSRLQSGDELMLVWRMSLTPKLGPTMEVEGVSHMRARDGRIDYHRDYWDLANLFAATVPGGRLLLRRAFKPFV